MSHPLSFSSLFPSILSPLHLPLLPSLSPFSSSLPPSLLILHSHSAARRLRQRASDRAAQTGMKRKSSALLSVLSSSSSPTPRPPPPPPAHTLSSPLRSSVHLHTSSVLLRTRKFVRLSISDHTSFSLSSVTLPSLASQPRRLSSLSNLLFVIPHSCLSLSSISLISLSSNWEAKDAAQVL